MSMKRKQIHGRNPSRGKETVETPVRVGGRIKKAKTIYDPSDHLFPRKRRMQEKTLLQSTVTFGEMVDGKHSSDDDDDDMELSNGEKSLEKAKEFNRGWCLVCLKNTPNLITCKRCSYKAHFECLEKKPGEKLENFENDWHCSQCKMCTVCEKKSDFAPLTQCWKCFQHYHSSCHRPRISGKSQGKKKWICMKCVDEDSEEESDESTENIEKIEESRESTPTSLTKRSKDNGAEAKISEENNSKSSGRKKESEEKEEKPTKEEKESIILNPFGDQLVPDASTWTAAEVYNYFLKHFPKEADVFREQEIDGASLVLMKRDDVVTGLKLKLGPAIRIYRHVIMLQKRSSDPRLAWP
ncbi:uncharacterized protein DMENIID0001_092830 [Sergentomyia squamirostris]